MINIHKVKTMKYSNYSTVIIGSGIAGLYASLKIEQQVELPDGILLITKSKICTRRNGCGYERE